MAENFAVAAAREMAAPRERERKLPVKRTRELELEILDRIAHGETLLQVVRGDPLMPSYNTVYNWGKADPEGFGAELDRAREVGLAVMAEEVFDIADDGRNDWIEKQRKDGETYVALNTEAIMRSKLRIDTRRWYLGIMSARYRENTDLNVNLKGGVVVAHITDRERAAKIAALMGRVAAREKALEDDLAPPAPREDDIA